MCSDLAHTRPVGTTTRAVLPLYQSTIYNFQNTSLLTDPYNQMGEPYVYVAIKDICEGNLVSSDGSQYNILAVLNLGDTPYGTYRGFEATDLRVDDVSFLDNINIHTADIMIPAYRQSIPPALVYVPLNHHITVILTAFWDH